MGNEQRHKRRLRWNGLAELKKEILSLRFFASCFLLLGLTASVATGVDLLIERTGVYISPWIAPHFFSNREYTGLYGFIICYMFSSVPFMGRSELYGVVRKSRYIWITEKLFAVIFEALLITLAGHLFCVLIFVPHVTIEADWGKMIYTIAYSHITADYNIVAYCYGNMLMNYTPIAAMLISIAMTWAVTAFIGLLMFMLSLYLGRMTALIIGVLLSGLNFLNEITLFVKWLKYITPFNWNALGRYGATIFGPEFYPTFVESSLILFPALIVIIALILFKARHMEFEWVIEEG